MGLYSHEMMEKYRLQGERVLNTNPKDKRYQTPFKRPAQQQVTSTSTQRLPLHVYHQNADDAYRAMMRSLENTVLMSQQPKRQLQRGESELGALVYGNPTNQSILVSGESVAGKTVTTKIVLNYLAMLSKMIRASQATGHEALDPEESRCG